MLKSSHSRRSEAVFDFEPLIKEPEDYAYENIEILQLKFL